MRSRGLLTVAIALAAASAAAARIAVVGPGGGGDIECVLASRHDPSRLFAGCDVGGFYFSADSGRRWEIRNVGLGCPGVQTIVEHPKDPNRLAIGGHAGILLSDDLGLNWHQATNGLPAPSPEGHSLPVVKILWGETNPRRLYAATGILHDGAERSRAAGTLGHIYRSDNGGETWEKTSPLPERHRMSDGREVMDSWGRMKMAVAPDDPDDVWLTGPWFREGLCRSRDGGATWVEALREVPRGWVNDFWSCPAVSLSISATFPSNIAFGTMSGVYASGDGGETWAQRYTAGIRGTEPANQDMGQQADDSKGGRRRVDNSKGRGQQADNGKWGRADDGRVGRVDDDRGMPNHG